MIPSIVNWEWWVRWIETRVITDEGIYAKDMVPENYGGPQLTVKIIQRVLLCTKSGHFVRLEFGDAALEVMDDERKKGMGITVAETGEVFPAETVAATGPSAKSVTWVIEENQSMTQTFRQSMAHAYAVALTNLEI